MVQLFFFFSFGILGGISTAVALVGVHSCKWATAIKRSWILDPLPGLSQPAASVLLSQLEGFQLFEVQFDSVCQRRKLDPS